MAPGIRPFVARVHGMHIHVDKLSKRFGSRLVRDGVNLDIHERKFVGLLGPSGSGKTTLLRILAGLEYANKGRVLFDGRDAQTLLREERQVGIVARGGASARKCVHYSAI